MSNGIKLGDVVQLKSGGPKMTATEVGNDGLGTPTVWCVWFEGNKRIEGTFPPAALKVVD
jgi:uncharacterized protein YodC (DUF2158 family)